MSVYSYFWLLDHRRLSGIEFHCARSIQAGVGYIFSHVISKQRPLPLSNSLFLPTVSVQPVEFILGLLRLQLQ